MVRTIKTGYVTRGGKETGGYLRVKLSKDDGTKERWLVHRLMAFMFLENPPDDSYTVDHIDRNPSNNDLNNLKWSSKSEQALNRKKRVGGINYPITQIIVNDQYPEGFEYFTWFKGKYASEDLKIQHGDIARACKNNYFLGGYKWKYARNSIEGEIWIQVSGGPLLDFYVSSMGRICNHKGKIGFGASCVEGYKNVTLKLKTGEYQKFRVHVLVAHAFLGDNNGKEVNHLDGNKKNNKSTNLKYVTSSENNQHAYDSGLKVASVHNYRNRKVRQYDLNGNFIKEYFSISEASRQIGISVPSIIRACKDFTKTAAKYRWKYT